VPIAKKIQDSRVYWQALGVAPMKRTMQYRNGGSFAAFEGRCCSHVPNTAAVGPRACQKAAGDTVGKRFFSNSVLTVRSILSMSIGFAVLADASSFGCGSCAFAPAWYSPSGQQRRFRPSCNRQMSLTNALSIGRRHADRTRSIKPLTCLPMAPATEELSDETGASGTETNHMNWTMALKQTELFRDMALPYYKESQEGYVLFDLVGYLWFALLRPQRSHSSK
jgi:hypothetical protein